MPGIYELIGGRERSRLREVDITDLLRREPTRVNESMIGDVLTGQRVLVTGAGGSIGRNSAARSPAESSILVVLGHGENSILRRPGVARFFPSWGGDRRRQRQHATSAVLNEHGVQIVYAAALALPLMQTMCSAALNNVLGTQNVVARAEEQGGPTGMLSTDKAIAPRTCTGDQTSGRNDRSTRLTHRCGLLGCAI
jgi:FlaA1/EpsC-like NDP-sugar epimerase